MNTLNEEQLKAVNFKKGPCLVLAGAGSGKTRVLTMRIASLIESGINPINILAITFTNKAANEIKERVNNLIGDNNAFIGTFHSLGFKIIRENYELLGYKRNISIIDSEDMTSIVKKIMKSNNIDSKEFSPSFIKSKISFIKNEMLSEGQIETLLNTIPDKIAVSVYYQYNELLKRSNVVDFDDLLLLPVKLLSENKSVLEHYQELYQYLLIDEYQDTNEVQYKFSKLLASKYKNIFVVGDPDQSIYAFRGSNFRNILNFEQDYKNTTVIPLETNYRSTKNILNVANSIIKNNKERKEKTLITKKESDVKVKYMRCYDEKHEITVIVEKINELLSEGYSLDQIAILYRTNAQGRVVEEVLLKNNLNYKIIGSFYFYSRREIKDLICYLKLLLNTDDDLSLQRVINVPRRKIGPKSINNLETKARIENTSMFEAIDGGKELEFKNLILELKKDSLDISLTELIDLILDKSGMKKELESSKSLEDEIRLDNLMEFKSITASFEERTGSVNLEDFLEEISLIADVNLHNNDKDALKVMTIHSAKGLEFDCVFLIGMEENLFPHSISLMEEGGVEEERRLCYVGVTRARDRLFITNAKRRMIYGKYMINPPSRFIDEIDNDLLDVEGLKEEVKVNKEDFYRNEDIEYKKGDLVEHELFKKGVVININGDIIEVAFSHGIGVKKLLKNTNKMKKV